MKFRVVVYCKDDLSNAIDAKLDEAKPPFNDEVREALWKDTHDLCAKKWFEYGEYLTVEIDTDAQTCVVVPVGKEKKG